MARKTWAQGLFPGNVGGGGGSLPRSRRLKAEQASEKTLSTWSRHCCFGGAPRPQTRTDPGKKNPGAHTLDFATSEPKPEQTLKTLSAARSAPDASSRREEDLGRRVGAVPRKRILHVTVLHSTQSLALAVTQSHSTLLLIFQPPNPQGRRDHFKALSPLLYGPMGLSFGIRTNATRVKIDALSENVGHITLAGMLGCRGVWSSVPRARRSGD